MAHTSTRRPPPNPTLAALGIAEDPHTWGHLRYTHYIIHAPFRPAGEPIEATYIAAVNAVDELVTAFGPLGPLRKRVYLDGALLRAIIPLDLLLTFMVPPPTEPSWLSTLHLVHEDHLWTPFCSYRLRIDDSALTLSDYPVPEERPYDIAPLPGPTRLATIRKNAI